MYSMVQIDYKNAIYKNCTFEMLLMTTSLMKENKDKIVFIANIQI
jgi:hypothetical protein